MPSETFEYLIRGRGLVPAVARVGLAAASLPYRVGVWRRNRGFDRSLGVVRVPVPVVCVGNLSLGGTGKTPCVEAVARHYRDAGLRVVILSRGYGVAGGPNDEALVLEENLPDVPHLQGADRVAIAATAVEELEPDVLVLDDGFQHRRLHRDLDVVLIDATAPPATDHLFPWGRLREPASGLRRAGFVLLTRCDQAGLYGVTAVRAWLKERFPNLAVAESEHRPAELVGGPEPDAVENVRGRLVLLVSGIGNPAAFAKTAADLGADVRGHRVFPDHHAYTAAEVAGLAKAAAALPPGSIILTTQKDRVKLRVPDLGGKPLRAVRIALAVTAGEDEFHAALDGVGVPG